MGLRKKINAISRAWQNCVMYTDHQQHTIRKWWLLTGQLSWDLPGVQSLLLGSPLDTDVLEQVQSRAAGWLGAGACGMEELGLFTFQNKAGWEGWPSTTACLEVCREERDRCFLEARGDRTRGKGCELEEGKIRSGIRKTCSQWSVTGMACAETLWDLRRWRWSKPNWT